MLVFKLHSRCNLDCNYCYMYRHGDESYLQAPKRVPWLVVENVVHMIRSHCEAEAEESFNISLHGGEPLLVGKAYMDKLLTYIRQQLCGIEVTFTLQTNAVLVDDDWIEIFNRHRITVGASLDGHESANIRRITHSGESSWQQTLEGVRLLRDNCTYFAGVLAVANPLVSGRDVVKFLIEELQLTWFDLLLPDYSHDHLPHNVAESEAKLLEFMIDAFDAWLPHALANNVQCRFFDNIMARLIGEQSHTDTIGNDGVSTVTVETDGSLAPHDALRVCRGFQRGTGLVAGPGGIRQLTASPAYTLALQQGRDLSSKCRDCTQFDFCKGGHLIHRWSNARGFQNPSVHCYTLFGLLSHVQRSLGVALLEQKPVPSAPISGYALTGQY